MTNQWQWGPSNSPSQKGNDYMGHLTQLSSTVSHKADALKAIAQNQKPSINPMYWMWGGGGLLLAFSLAFGGVDSINEMNQKGKALQAQRSQLHDRTNQLELAQIEMEESAAYAEYRYLNGCTFLVSTQNSSIAVSVIAGEPVLNSETGKPLANGTVVCDTVGNTGVIKGGVVSDVAFTGDYQIVKDAMIAQGWTFTEGDAVKNSYSGQGNSL